MVRDLDIRCPRGHCPSNNTALKVQTQGTSAKDFFHSEKPKTKDPNQSLHVITRQSRLRRKTSRKDLNSNKNALENERKPWPLVTTLLTPLKKRRSMTLVRSCVSTAIRKATIPAIAPSQKTSVSFSNLYAGD